MAERIEQIYDRVIAEEKLKSGTKYERLTAVAALAESRPRAVAESGGACAESSVCWRRLVLRSKVFPLADLPVRQGRPAAAGLLVGRDGVLLLCHVEVSAAPQPGARAGLPGEALRVGLSAGHRPLRAVVTAGRSSRCKLVLQDWRHSQGPSRALTRAQGSGPMAYALPLTALLRNWCGAEASPTLVCLSQPSTEPHSLG